MSGKPNEEMQAMTFVMAIIGAAALFLFAFIAAIAAFAAVIMTIMALIAWNKPLELGEYILEPQDAREFVYRGIAGAIILPIFIFFCVFLFQIETGREFENAIPYFFLAGYVVGSVGLEFAMAAEENSAASHTVSTPTIIQEPERENHVEGLPAPRTSSEDTFRYADWDDEEARS